ncbi:MAG: hypothetical protein ABSA76_03345 [Bacteroidales bacterium]
MSKKLIAIFSLLIILTFIGYIIYDTAVSRHETETKPENPPAPVYTENWIITKEFLTQEGALTSVAISGNGLILLGGESFVSCYNSDFSRQWTLKMPERITAIAVFRDSVYASSSGKIFIITSAGKQIGEWGPYEVNSIFTSLSANTHNVAVADAGNKIVFILRKDGEVIGMIGQRFRKFIIPSSYFDVELTDPDTMYVANTGNHRIEKWTTTGIFISEFGKPGVGPDEFNACCNPAHFALIPGGFVTAEKGLNRIKILGTDGGFIEFVSVNNKFVPSVPLDVASADGKTIYAANEADSKLYVFKRK